MKNRLSEALNPLGQVLGLFPLFPFFLLFLAMWSQIGWALTEPEPEFLIVAKDAPPFYSLALPTNYQVRLEADFEPSILKCDEIFAWVRKNTKYLQSCQPEILAESIVAAGDSGEDPAGICRMASAALNALLDEPSPLAFSWQANSTPGPSKMALSKELGLDPSQLVIPAVHSIQFISDVRLLVPEDSQFMQISRAFDLHRLNEVERNENQFLVHNRLTACHLVHESIGVHGWVDARMKYQKPLHPAQLQSLQDFSRWMAQQSFAVGTKGQDATPFHVGFKIGFLAAEWAQVNPEWPAVDYAKLVFSLTSTGEVKFTPINSEKEARERLKIDQEFIHRMHFLSEGR